MPFELFMTNKALIQAMRKVSKLFRRVFYVKLSLAFATYYGFTSFNSAGKIKK